MFARHAGRYLNSGVNEVHIVFDDPGQFDMHPKDIERTQRDTPNHEVVHEHIPFDDTAKIPSKWRDVLGCRKCKHDE